MILKRNMTLFALMIVSIGSIQLLAMDDDAADNIGTAVTSATGSHMMGSMAEHGAQAVIKEFGNPNIQEKIEAQAEKVANFGERKAKEVRQDLGNIFSDMSHSIHTMKSPAIAKQVIVLSMQGKYVQAQTLRKKATSPYYGYGVLSAITGATLLATIPFSKEGGRTLEVSALCLAASLGCYYKTRHDVSKLTMNIEQQCAATSLQRLFKNDKHKFHENLIQATKIKVAKKNDKKRAGLSSFF